MSDKKKVRVERGDRQRLKELADHPAIQEAFEDLERITYEEVLQVVLPDEVNTETILERPEEDMVFINVSESAERIHQLAGENVSAHTVVSHYLNEFEEETHE